jgi:uncharacterized protein (DUF1800 family)
MPLLEFTGVLGIKRAAHLLRRATFGATKQQIDSFAALTPAQATQQLFRQALPDPPLPLNPENGLEWVTNGTTVGEQSDQDLQECFKGWFIGQMLSQGVSPALSLAYSAREKIVFFFHTHFTAIQSKIDNSRALYYQNQLFRRYSLDATIANPLINFKELTKKVSVDNAMLLLLDGYLNVKGSVNENYARELLELYTIGRGLEGSFPTASQGDYGVYTEQDVQTAAKLLSGWDFDDDFITLDLETNLPRGKVKGSITSASAHDNSAKTFSARLASSTITPIAPGDTGTEASMLDEISKLVDLVYAQTETPKNICRKIYRFFVFAPHDNATRDAIETAAITEMANTLVANNFKILPVIENLLRSVHFYEAGTGIGDDNFGAIIKSPLDLALGTIRYFNIPIPDQLTATKDFYAATDYIIEWLNTSHMGMNFYEPFDVSGYDAYAQYPVYHRSWISVNYLARRYEFMRNLIDPMSDSPLKLDVLQYVNSNINMTIASNARNLVLELIKYLFPVTENLTFDTNADDNLFPAQSGLTAERLNYFLKTFLDDIDADPETAWTNRYTAQTGVDTIQAQLRFLFNALLQSPEFQLA